MPYETIVYSKEGGVGTITLNRPDRLNAINTQMSEEFVQVLDEVAQDTEVRALIITGGEKVFCAGADIGELTNFSGMVAYNWLKGAQHAFCKFEALTKPVIAAISGVALGGGCELSLVCDFRIASEKAQFGLSEINLGALPGGGGMIRLPRLIGLSRAKEILYTGDPIGAEEAYRVGLANKVVPADKLMDTARELAEKLAGKAPLSMQMAKSIINTSMNMDMTSALDFEIEGVALLFSTRDFKEGTRAFLEKRKPAFTGE